MAADATVTSNHSFNVIPALGTESVVAQTYQSGTGVWISMPAAAVTVDDARRLRDWLTRALPDETFAGGLTEVRDRTANVALTCSGACRYSNGALIADPACGTHGSQMESAEPVAFVGYVGEKSDIIYPGTTRLEGRRYLPIWRLEDHPAAVREAAKSSPEKTPDEQPMLKGPGGQLIGGHVPQEEPAVAPTPEHAKTGTYVTIVCDGCHTQADLPRVGREGEFMSLQPAKGWELYPQHLCPKCLSVKASGCQHDVSRLRDLGWHHCPNCGEYIGEHRGISNGGQHCTDNDCRCHGYPLAR